ncbi:hypothetical protein [Egicoccus sp. AB-alg6-2]|uniref:hypothetical protein n=1 Tax=Egicoccus sp. AB-alg6-2 TaxID=3242692 RepID=UPI00359CD873
MSAPVTGSAWLQVLEQLEADIAEYDIALAGGELVPVQTWVPPRDLGPLPDELQPRAQRLAVHLAGLQSRTRDRLGELSAQLNDVDRRRRAGTAYAG